LKKLKLKLKSFGAIQKTEAPCDMSNQVGSQIDDRFWYDLYTGMYPIVTNKLRNQIKDVWQNPGEEAQP
jgi:hypothetical protein